MRLSTRGRYGLRIMLDLALHENKGPSAIKDISKRQGISEKYLWRLMDALKAAGLIKSILGSRGGYILARSLSKITLKEIVTVLEGPLCLTDCIENPTVCERADLCVARDVWKEASDKIADTLNSMTLQDIVERHKTKIENSFSYTI